mmetsp:Transcript_102303/g.318668  ORF Transcript_102303/g.318668 Transcript_102303/m.318668 type:complete len:91 (+) Transcript_102303:4-276(+)
MGGPMKVLEAPQYGTRECPSVGSALHSLGMCKPCDFVHRRTCRTGAACKFCHLCGPSESRRRKKEEQRAKRVALQRRQLPAAVPRCGAAP